MPFRSFTSSIFSGVKPSASRPIPVPETIPLDVPIDEETAPNYQADAFYPANPGDVLNGKFELLAKLGWGTSSTVWLARDVSWKRLITPNNFVAIKICTKDASEEDTSHELDIIKHLTSVKSEHRGRAILGTAIEGFGLESPTGSTHLALVFEATREPFWLFRRRIMGEDKCIHPLVPLVKAYIKILLEGLDFLHSEAHIVHTDLKLDNIMVTFEDQFVIEKFVQGQGRCPMARKTVGDRTIYRCHNNFGEIDGKEALKKMYPKITDFGLAQRMDNPGPHIHPIQPNECHAPEVLLGTGWSYRADIWNFGIMIWDLLAGKVLFQQGDSRLQVYKYSPVAHLAEMIALLGPVPPTLIQRERDMRSWKWSPKARNARGELCNNAADFYGGPFFTGDGEFVRNDLVLHTQSLQSELPDCIAEEEADHFLRFMKRMLCWLPEERATAKELRNDPWFDEDV